MEKEQIMFVGSVSENIGNTLNPFDPFLNSMTCKEFSKIDFPKQQWLIENLIPREGLIIMAAPSGEKKTWLAMEMARSVANGTNFLGNDEFKTQKGRVLYLNLEMSKTEFQRRVKLLRLHQTEENIYLLGTNEYCLNNQENVDYLANFIDQQKISFVVIDTLRATAGGLKEEKAEDVRKFFDLFKRFKDKGVAIIFLDHCKKPNHFDGKIPKKEHLFASQDKLASVEGLIMLKSTDRLNEINVYHRKSRNSIEYKPFKIEIVDRMGVDFDDAYMEFKYGGGIDEKEYKIDEARESILSLLIEGPKLREEIIKSVYDSKKIAGKNVSDALRLLERIGRIESEWQGRKKQYFLMTKDPLDDYVDNGTNPDTS